MRRPRSPLGRRLVVLTVAVSSSLAFVITAVQLMLEYQRDLDDMSAHFAIIGQSYLPSIEETVWLLDQKRLDTLLEGIARLPDFRYADVQHDGRTIAAKGTREPSMIRRQFDLLHEYRGTRIKIGVLTAGASLEALQARLWTRPGLVLAANTLKAGVVGLFMLVLIEALVVRRLGRMAAQAEDYRDGRPWQRVDGATARDDDEIGELGRALDAMAGRVEQSLAELRQLNADLESRVAARTSELTQARDAALRANQAKSDFLSNMSHELRTPLNAILGFAQLLRIDPTLTAEQREQIEEILGAGRHLLELIGEVLDLARIESGSVELRLAPVELSRLVSVCTTLVSPQMRARHIACDVDIAPGLAVCADPVRLRQVLLNLLSNAIKYNREGGRVEIRAGVDDVGVRIAVRDTGPGIPAERRAELFQPFNRLGAEHSGIDGSGIGLVISERLVRLMGGRIGVESEPGAGSTFWLELPQPDAGASEAPSVAPASADGLQTTRPRAVLVVDTRPADLKLMAQVIGLRPRIGLLTAGSLAEAIAIARSHEVDLVVAALDDFEPGMLASLRQLPGPASTGRAPVVGLAVDGQRAERAIADGEVEAIVWKPLDVPHLLSTIDGLLPA